MSVFYKKHLVQKVRQYVLYCLTFFCISQLICCQANRQFDKIEIQWKNQKAIAVIIPLKQIASIPKDSISKQIEIRLNPDRSVAILGNYLIKKESVLFTPLIPFTRGLTYEIWLNGKQIGNFDIPKVNSSNAPALLGLFPSADTLPENLLKVYIHFSQPMREGQSAKYVTLIKNNADTVKGAFLDLQPELWNPDRTILTLWLDPGRIKRDLQPNKLFGAPLQKNSNYQIIVSKDWQNEQGASLTKLFIKHFVITARDSVSPDPVNWKIFTPKRATKQVLKVDPGEALDYSLLMETLSVKNLNGADISGKWQMMDQERKFQFQPDLPWNAGEYILQIETRLEDLAGNNLERPFDRDITKVIKTKRTSRFVHVPFSIPN